MWTVRDVILPLALFSMVFALAGFAIQVWPAEWGGGGGPDAAPDFQLYDCVPVSELDNPASASGAGEIVSIGGEDYVRMTSVGDLVLKARSGRTTTYTVGPAHMDLVLLTGQSNSVYYTSPQYYEGGSPVAPGMAFYLGSEEGSGTLAGIADQSDVWSSGIVDMVAEDGGVRVSQMYPAFMSGYVHETGHRVLVANSGIGGRAIASWDPNGVCDLWTQTVLERVEQIASDGSLVLTPVLVLWSQGESDADETQEYYEERLQKLVERLTGGAYPYSFPKVLSVLPRHPDHAGEINPALAQEAFAEESGAFSIASTLPLRFTSDQTRDGIHYTQEAYGWLGEAFARTAAMEIGRAPEVQTIVLAESPGEVSELPAEVAAYGTSGEGFRLSAEWAEDTDGYVASLSGNPFGTMILDGLTAEATLTQS